MTPSRLCPLCSLPLSLTEVSVPEPALEGYSATCGECGGTFEYLHNKYSGVCELIRRNEPKATMLKENQ